MKTLFERALERAKALGFWDCIHRNGRFFAMGHTFLTEPVELIMENRGVGDGDYGVE